MARLEKATEVPHEFPIDLIWIEGRLIPRVVNMDTGKDIDLWSLELQQDPWSGIELTFSYRERVPHLFHIEKEYHWMVMQRAGDKLYAALTRCEVHFR